MAKLAHDLWMLGEQVRFVGYGLIPNKFLQGGKFTIKELYETNQLEKLKDISQFEDYADGSKFPEYTNMITSIVDMMKYYEYTLDGLMSVLDEVDGARKIKEDLEKRRPNGKWIY